ncbi:Hydroxyacyl-thioester dehydratase type 2 protein [Thalictrum thalictroides]|uniref:Hydroxyacyl-thioester dehydratase type 2 protein n=1 Tax=Thalictrum thalictroides TaxID=46969 RepID=A0A7J6WN62_THATH|nr:Hydroxyacyl-thioester dehydratase type 2 protein [Thalictrum thalictroides]
MFPKTLNSIFISVSKFSSSSSALFKIGDVLKKSRTFTDTDVLKYSELTHDSNPLHFDSEVARNFGYNDRIVHGMLIAALFPQIIASHFPGVIYASQSLQFKLPVYIGEEVVAEIKALNLRLNKDRYISKFSTKCYKNGDLCIDGEAVALLPTLVMDVEKEQS